MKVRGTSKFVVNMVLVSLLVCNFLSIGCFSGRTVDDYEAAIISGFQKISPAQQIHENFESVDHKIMYFGSQPKTTWTTTAFFEDRYRLTMQCQIIVDSRSNDVALADEPKFLFFVEELIDIDETGLSSSVGDQMLFDGDQWKKIVVNNFDFKSIGFEVKQQDPVKNFSKFVSAFRSSIVKVPAIEDHR